MTDKSFRTLIGIAKKIDGNAEGMRKNRKREQVGNKNTSDRANVAAVQSPGLTATVTT